MAGKDYKASSVHQPGLFPRETDLAAPILFSGIMKQVEEQIFWNDPEPENLAVSSLSGLGFTESVGDKPACHSQQWLYSKKLRRTSIFD